MTDDSVRTLTPYRGTTGSRFTTTGMPESITLGGEVELELVRACGRAPRRNSAPHPIAAFVQGPLDWQRVIELAIRHRMLPLVAAHLKPLARYIPEPALTRLHATEIENACRTLNLTGELIRIARAFREQDVLVVPYKGPALSLQLYGTVSLRAAGDLDLLVRRQDVARARALLIGMGYRSLHPFGDDDRQAFVTRSRYSETLRRDDGIAVELHWAFTNRDIALSLDLDQLVPRLSSIQIGHDHLSVFGTEDLIIILCVHGAKHRWDRLEWLCGLAEAMRLDGIDWDSVLQRAAALRAGRMLLLGVLLARDILDAPLPPAVLRRARSDSVVVELAEQVPFILAAPLSEAESLSLPMDLFRIRLTERRRDRFRFILYRLTTPSRPEHWTFVRVGRRSVAVHALLRPFQLIFKMIPAIRWYIRFSRSRSAAGSEVRPGPRPRADRART